MEIKQLRYFKRVADAGSVSRAAATLSVAQPAVSRQIANLEEGLGTPLFFRNGRGVKLTDAGAQLYGRASEILEAVRMAEQDVRDTVGVARGSVLVGAPPSIVRHVAPGLFKTVAANHPELCLAFTEGLSGYVNEWLSNGLLDVAIIHDATRTQHFLTEPLVREDLVVVHNEAGTEPMALRDLSDVPLILPRRTHGLRLLLERSATSARVELNVTAEVDCVPAIKELVRRGVGVSILPRGTVYGDDGLTVRALVQPSLSRSLLLATSSQRPVSQSTRAVIQALKGIVKDLVETELWPGAHRGTDRPVSIGRVEPAAQKPTNLDQAA
ncbi:MAG: LysR family transcriptional regulator [Pseudomonadota bacterium]